MVNISPFDTNQDSLKEKYFASYRWISIQIQLYPLMPAIRLPYEMEGETNFTAWDTDARLDPDWGRHRIFDRFGDLSGERPIDISITSKQIEDLLLDISFTVKYHPKASKRTQHALENERQQSLHNKELGGQIEANNAETSGRSARNRHLELQINIIDFYSMRPYDYQSISILRVSLLHLISSFFEFLLRPEHLLTISIGPGPSSYHGLFDISSASRM